MVHDVSMSLQGKTVLICGLANERSLAAAIAEQLDELGAQLIVSYQDERMRERVERVCGSLKQDPILIACDVLADDGIAALGAAISDASLKIDGLVHAIAYGRLFNDDHQAIPVHAVSQDDFNQAMQISAHSLARLCQHLQTHFTDAASVVALTYAGATQVKDGYNLMGIAKAALEAEIRYLAHEFGGRGIRVNGISAGPIRTLASSGVPGFKQRLADHAERSMLNRNVEASEVAAVAAFLLSSAASGVSSEIIFVDGGAHNRA